MSLTFNQPLTIQRPYKSFRFDVFSLKARRRMTLYGKPALCQFVELEANPEVTDICERPLIIPDSVPKRVVDFWALEGAVPTFYLLMRNGELGESSKLKLPYKEFVHWVDGERGKVREISIDVFETRRTRLENWLMVVQHLVVHRGQVTPALLDRCSEEMPKEFKLVEIEERMHDVDAMLVRAAAFHLLARGSLRCPTIDEQQLHSQTILVRP